LGQPQKRSPRDFSAELLQGGHSAITANVSRLRENSQFFLQPPPSFAKATDGRPLGLPSVFLRSKKERRMPSAALAEENEKTWQNKISDHFLRLHSTRHQPSRSALYWKHKQFTQTPRGTQCRQRSCLCRTPLLTPRTKKKVNEAIRLRFMARKRRFMYRRHALCGVSRAS